ncbi:MAG: hypothetical protein OHK0052_17760 [Anaerolineales bacterium]
MKSFFPPFGVTFVGVFVLIFALFFLTRAYTVWSQWDFLQTYLALGVRLYLFLSGVLWSVLGFWLLAALVKQPPSARAWRAALWGAPIFTACHLAERWIAGIRTAPQPNTLFQIFWSLFLLAIFWLVLHHPKTKAYYYGDKHDPKTRTS